MNDFYFYVNIKHKNVITATSAYYTLFRMIFWFFLFEFYQLKIWKRINSVYLFNEMIWQLLKHFRFYFISNVSMKSEKSQIHKMMNWNNVLIIKNRFNCKRHFIFYQKHVFPECIYAGNCSWGSLCRCVNGLRRCKLYVITSGVTKIKICTQNITLFTGIPTIKLFHTFILCGANYKKIFLTQQSKRK